MNPRVDFFAVSIVFILSLGAVIIPLSDNAFAQVGEGLTFQERPPGSETFPSDLIPNGNLSEPSDFGSPLGLESPEFDIPDVNGTYVNSDAGFQIDLPKDWNGKEITFLVDLVIAAPPGVEIEAINEPGTAMIIQAIDEETFNELARMQSLGLGGDNSTQESGDPLAIGGGEGEQCNELPASFVTINGLKAEQRSADCTDEEGNAKIKAYTFATADGTIILLAFSANSADEYNLYLPQFEESVKTIKVSQPGDIATSELFIKHKEIEIQSQATN